MKKVKTQEDVVYDEKLISNPYILFSKSNIVSQMFFPDTPLSTAFAQILKRSPHLDPANFQLLDTVTLEIYDIAKMVKKVEYHIKLTER